MLKERMNLPEDEWKSELLKQRELRNSANKRMDDLITVLDCVNTIRAFLTTGQLPPKPQIEEDNEED